MTSPAPRTGYAPVNGLQLYYELHGEGPPLVLLHGGFGVTTQLGPLLPRLAEKHQVIAVELQGHGHTADIDRPLRCEQMAEDIAALLRHLGHAQADLVGNSLGAGVALRVALQHPSAVRRLVVVSAPMSRQGWFPEVREDMARMDETRAEMLMRSPLYQAYAAVAPRPEDFRRLVGKMGDLLRQEYDWSREVEALRMPVLLVYGDHDSIQPAHMVEFFGRLGGGQRDPGWTGSGMGRARLAILPGLTHYNLFLSPQVVQVVLAFLEQAPQG
jgi:pimeloyl-ACP methyl ester carboxylesterase